MRNKIERPAAMLTDEAGNVMRPWGDSYRRADKAWLAHQGKLHRALERRQDAAKAKPMPSKAQRDKDGYPLKPNGQRYSRGVLARPSPGARRNQI